MSDTEKIIYRRGVEYAAVPKTVLTKIFNNACEAVARGSETYTVTLGFNRVGSPKTECTCPYFEEHGVICKHIIGAALAWDRTRAVPDPDEETIEELCIPDPLITRADINKAYSNPLEADLQVLRMAADEMGWSRPHARLPDKPKMYSAGVQDSKDVKKGISELRSWSRRYSFDPYFCAGEIVAAFCELARLVKSSWVVWTIDEKIKTLTLLVKFNSELIMEIIDDSDGLHEFTEAHLFDMINYIGRQKTLTPEYKTELETLKKDVADY